MTSRRASRKRTRAYLGQAFSHAVTSGRGVLAGMLLPAVLAYGCVVSSVPRAEPSSPSTVIPLLDFHGRPVVEVMLSGQGPFRFILDSGADVSVVDVSLAGRLELETLAEEQIGSPLGGTVTASRLRVPEVVVSGLALGTLDLLAIDLAAVIGAGDAPVGVLATAAFEGRSLVLDLSQPRLSVSEAPLPPADGVQVVDFCAASGKPSLIVEVGGPGQRHCVNVDTGSPAILALPLSVAETLPLDAAPTVRGHARLVGAEVELWGARLEGELRVGQVSLSDPELGFHETAPIGNLGVGFLRQVELTVDHANRRLRVRSPGSAVEAGSLEGPVVRRIVSPVGTKRYGIRFGGSIEADLVVAGVDPGSPAELGGVRAGDRILALNGQAVEELDSSDRVRALRGSPLHLGVERDGKRVELDLRLD